MAKKQKTLTRVSELHVILVTIAMPIVALVILLIAVSLNQRGGPKSYTNSFDSTFYHELIAVAAGYFISFLITAFIFSASLVNLGKRMPVGVGWLAITLLFWRYQAMGIKSLDCGGRWSTDCTHILPNKLDNTITAVVFVSLFILSVAAYGWFRIVQEIRR